jgi:hypothetical protein
MKKAEKIPVFNRKKLLSELGFWENTITTSDPSGRKFDNCKFVTYTKKLLKDPGLIVEITYSYEKKKRDGKWLLYGKPYVALCVDAAVDIPLPKIKNNEDLARFVSSLALAIEFGITKK